MAAYELPDLPYDYSALEPHISGEIMELHHDKHHRAYVEGANAAIEALSEARKSGDSSHLAAHEHALAFNLSGHVLHSMFWQNLAPASGSAPEGALADAIRKDFGALDALKKQFTEAAQTVMGSGWGALVLEPLSKQLITLQFHDHQSATVQGAIPLLVIDAWEHAYYLQYGPKRADYLAAIWNVVNWADVAHRFDAVKDVDLGLRHTVETAKAAASRAA